MVNSSILANFDQILRTTRLQLVPQSSLHAKEMFKVLNDVALGEFTGDKPPASEESLEIRFARLESRMSSDGSEYWLNWVVQDENSDLIGYVQATVSINEAYIAWVIGSKWQGMRYASEAAIALVSWLKLNNVRRIRACVLPGHIASQCVAKNAGLIRINEIIDGEDVWELVV